MKTCTRLLMAGALGAAVRICMGGEALAGPAEPPPPFTARQFQSHAAHLASDELAGRAPGSDGSEKAARYIVRHFEQAGLKPLQSNGSWFQEFGLDKPDPSSGNITAKNILGLLPGKGTLAAEAVIVCAHYDHIGTKTPRSPDEDVIFNGADDNASGVAALLLVASAAADASEALPESHRTILFVAWDAEEQGLRGARYYVERPLWPLERTAAVINFDSVGRMRMEQFFASDAETNPLLAEAVRAAARDCGIVAQTRFGGHGRSDHAVFVDRQIPGMHFFTGATIDYHQVTDEVELLNCDGGAKIARVAYQVLRQAITYAGPIAYQKPDPSFDVTFLLNFLRTVGIVPNVNAQEGRYPQILFVIPNSPAAKNGLQSADQITALNGIQFTRVEDALTIFQQLTFEEGLRISILRGERQVELVIPASAFEELSGPLATRLENGKYAVDFRFQAPAGAKAVYLAGDFNDWQPTAHRMDGPDEDRFFTTRLELDEGVYEYKFVIEGKDWVPDPRNMYRIGANDNNILRVGKRSSGGN